MQTASFTSQIQVRTLADQDAKLHMSEVIAALSHALDITEGQPMGHATRSCILAVRIAQHTGLAITEQTDLYYAALLKDAGCSANASRLFNIVGTDEIRAKKDVKTTDWTRVSWESVEYALSHIYTGAPFLERIRKLFSVVLNQKRQSREIVQIRCTRGANIARRMGLSERTALAIGSLDEHWDGGGYPEGLRGNEIPFFARILNLAQTLEVFHNERGAEAAISVARDRSGTWFDPDLVRAVLSLSRAESFWAGLSTESSIETVLGMDPEVRPLTLDEDTLDSICLAFADIVDAKSPFTYRHSIGVADAAVAISRALDFPEEQVRFMRRAALLHDIGKLSVSNAILEKPAKLDAGEWEKVKKHPFYTWDILRRIPGFGQLSEVAAAHHEKLDGKGYFRNWGADQLSLPCRILAVADIYDALAARRPYRDALPAEKVFGILNGQAPVELDASCLEALKASGHQHTLMAV